MASEEPVKLLILEESKNRTEELVVLLRTAGRAAHAHQIDSPADLTKQLNEQPWDLLLASDQANGLTAVEAMNQVNSLNKDVPLILIADDRELASINRGMKLGAVDVALDDDDERLLLIIQRELKNVEVKRQKERAETELRETDLRNQLLLDSSTAAISYVHEGMHIYANQAYVDLFRYEDADEFAGIPLIDLVAGSDQEKFKKFLKSFKNEGSEAEEFNCVNSEGSDIACNLTLSPANYDGEQCTQIIIRTMVDNSELEDRIKEISSQDPLTGLFNRQHLIDKVDLAVSQATKGEGSSAVLYVDIDKFSKVRNEAGFSDADLVLADLASFIRSLVSEEHLMGRLGDDVFCVLCKDGDKDKAVALAEKIRAKVDGHLIDAAGKSYQVTVRIGVSLLSESTASTEEVISQAHKAADAIEDGNEVKFFEPETTTAGEDGAPLTDKSIQDLVRKAVEGNALKLVFQPIISLHGDDDEQFEVLLRLLDDEENELDPSQFLGPAEEAGLLEKIDRWVILQSIKDLSKQRESGSKARLFINITHASVSDETFLPWMSVALKAAKLPSDSIIFQISESDAGTYLKQASKFYKGLAKLHCQTSINHFGCSTKPLKLLKYLATDFVILDESFTQKLDKDEEKQQHLVELVKSLQTTGVMTAIAGVESAAVLPTLWEAGVSFIQGFYISPPLETMEYDFSDEDL